MLVGCKIGKKILVNWYENMNSGWPQQKDYSDAKPEIIIRQGLKWNSAGRIF
jgi:hypothetical protein